MLFNKDNRGSEELQRITGNFAASNDYSVISSEIDDAIRNVSLLVGTEVVAKAEWAYESEDAEFAALVAAIQKPVAVLAVNRYSARNLVSHDDSGSKVKVDDNEKIPFEWMIDRDERAGRERYFRALDALYSYLESSELPEWKESYIRKTYKCSIVRSIREFEQVYPIDGSYYVYYMLQNLVVECQGAVRKMIGSERWEAISAAQVSDSDLVLLRLCQRYAILSAIIHAVYRWSLEVFPLSIARRFSPSYQGNKESRASTLDEMRAYIAGLEGQLRETRDDIATVLKDGRNPYEGFDLMPKNDPRNKFFTT